MANYIFTGCTIKQPLTTGCLKNFYWIWGNVYNMKLREKIQHTISTI